MEWLKNIAINLRATGPAAVIIVWLICSTVLGIWGNGPQAKNAMLLMFFAGGGIIISLSRKVKDS